MSVRAAVVVGFLVVTGITGCTDQSGRTESVPPVPTDPIVQRWEALASRSLASGALLTGLAYADSARTRAPFSSNVAFIRGRLLFELGLHDRADSAFAEVVRIEPSYRGAWFNRGNAAFARARYADALSFYRREALRNPDPMPWHALGATYEKMGLADSARIAFDRALEIDASYAPARFSLATQLEVDGRFHDALREATRALEADSSNLDFRYRVGVLLLRTGEPARALPLLSSITSAHPWDYAARVNEGRALQALGRSEEAGQVLADANRVRAAQSEVERLETDLRAYPGRVEAQVAYADALRQSGRLDEALKGYLAAVALKPQDLMLRNNLATMYLRLGNEQEALSRYRDVLRQDSMFVETWLNLALYYGRTGRPEEADRLLAHAERLDPTHPMVLRLLSLRRRD